MRTCRDSSSPLKTWCPAPPLLAASQPGCFYPPLGAASQATCWSVKALDRQDPGGLRGSAVGLAGPPVAMCTCSLLGRYPWSPAQPARPDISPPGETSNAPLGLGHTYALGRHSLAPPNAGSPWGEETPGEQAVQKLERASHPLQPAPELPTGTGRQGAQRQARTSSC